MESAEKVAVARARSRMWEGRCAALEAWGSFVEKNGPFDELDQLKALVADATRRVDEARAEHIVANVPALRPVIGAISKIPSKPWGLLRKVVKIGV